MLFDAYDTDMRFSCFALLLPLLIQNRSSVSHFDDRAEDITVILYNICARSDSMDWSVKRVLDLEDKSL